MRRQRRNAKRPKKAQEVEADAIGLSALLVSTSKQMPLCVQELDKRGLEFSVGG